MNNIQFGINKDLLNFLLNEGNYLIENKNSKSEEIHLAIILKLAKIYSKIPIYLNMHAD